MSENRPALVADSYQSVPVSSAASPSVPTTSYDNAVEIAQLCKLAGMADKTLDFLASGQSVTQVRQSLLTAKADVPVISGHLPPFVPQHSDLVMSIVKRRLGETSK